MPTPAVPAHRGLPRIDRVGVLGSGVMGATIAAHLANAGMTVLLLDLVPTALSPEEAAAGLALGDPRVRNRLAAGAVARLEKLKPAPLYLAADAARIEPGNLEDHLARLAECDWVVEVVLEDLAVKKALFERIAPHLRADAVLSSNTSGLSVNTLADALPEVLRPRFLVTHFFNPPRYMRLVEVVSSRHTDPAVARAMADLIGQRLGKGIVVGKDTPNFVANRIGVFAMCNAVHHMVSMGLGVEEVDAVSGPATARPGSAIFRTADLVGLDTLAHVARNSFELLPGDERRDTFALPPFVGEMVKQGRTGNKAGQGFYKKVKGEGGGTLAFDWRTGEYRPPQKPRFASVDAARGLDDPGARVRAVLAGDDPAATLAWRNLRDTLLYAFRRVPEIADDYASVDRAMRWGFSWELGPFELLDAVGVAEFVRRVEADGVEVPAGLREVERFYAWDGAAPRQRTPGAKGLRDVPQPAGTLDLGLLRRAGREVAHRPGASVLDLGDGVFCLEFHSKMNTIGADTLELLHEAVRRAEHEGLGLVVGNQGPNFSAGANLAPLVAAIEGKRFDEVDAMVRAFQGGMMALKYARVPVVAAPHGLSLGGGCETCLHSDAVAPLGETYMGLVEIGVGLLPAGGGTKELALRAIRLARQFDADVSPFVFRHFATISMAKVSASGAELAGLGFTRHGDQVTLGQDRQLHDAKQKALALAASYRPSRPATDLEAPGRGVAASMASQLWNLRMGGFITPYEEQLGRTIARVLTGGEVPGGTVITEQWLLDLEREAFVSLCGEPRTLERLKHMLEKGKPLRN